MDLNRPLSVICSTLDADVLSVLAGAEASFSGRQVHQIMGRHSEKSARNSLQRMCAQGVVIKEQAGSYDLYSLNREHLAAPYILGLANLKSELLSNMKQTLEAWKIKPIFAAIFGSAARGEMHIDSDIDIFIVRPERVTPDTVTWEVQIASLEFLVTRWTGNDTRIYELSQSEVVTGLSKKERVLTDIRDQAIVLLGETSLLRISKLAKKGTSHRNKAMH